MPITVVRVELDGDTDDDFYPWECKLSGPLWPDDRWLKIDGGLAYPNYIYVNATDELDALARAMRILAKLEK